MIKVEGNLVTFYVLYPIDLDNYLAELTLRLPLTKGKVCGVFPSIGRF
ncbi:hypothetical protein AAFM79_13990 [Trichormus azollae HNT15244]